MEKRVFEKRIQTYAEQARDLLGTPSQRDTLADRILSSVRPQARTLAAQLLGNLGALHPKRTITLDPTTRRDVRHQAWCRRQAELLAEAAGYASDDHGRWTPGDTWDVVGIDFVPAWDAQATPFCDHSGAGLALVVVTRRRIYARRSRWTGSTATDAYLVGRNEVGTAFAHPVPASRRSVWAALDWIWSAQADLILQRQGDIALVRARGPRMPARLPTHHMVDPATMQIVHPTHPPLRLPGPGERVIVARRAHSRVTPGTRD